MKYEIHLVPGRLTKVGDQNALHHFHPERTVDFLTQYIGDDNHLWQIRTVDRQPLGLRIFGIVEGLMDFPVDCYEDILRIDMRQQHWSAARIKKLIPAAAHLCHQHRLFTFQITSKERGVRIEICRNHDVYIRTSRRQEISHALQSASKCKMRLAPEEIDAELFGLLDLDALSEEVRSGGFRSTDVSKSDMTNSPSQFLKSGKWRTRYSLAWNRAHPNSPQARRHIIENASINLRLGDWDETERLMREFLAALPTKPTSRFEREQADRARQFLDKHYDD